MFSEKRWSVKWRHATLDTPTYPYRGGGTAVGRTRKRALDNYFNPWGINGDTSYLWDILGAYKRGELEVETRRDA